MARHQQQHPSACRRRLERGRRLGLLVFVILLLLLGVAAQASTVTTIAGTGIQGYTGDGLPAGDCEVRGLALYGFPGAGVLFAGTGAHVLQGNHLGTDSSGTTAIANGVGVIVESDGNTIGGTGPGDGNLTSGNSGGGISLAGGATGNPIRSIRPLRPTSSATPPSSLPART